MSTKQIFESLIGTWAIKRVLGNYGTAEGIAKFTLLNKSQLNSKVNTDTETASTTGVSATITSLMSLDDKLAVVLYREDLEVKHNNHNLTGKQTMAQKNQNTAYKEYVYLYDESRDKIIKKFTDGRLFYELSIDFEQKAASGDHLCDKDFYRAMYHFTDSQHFTLAYDVKGPEKDYCIQTEFTKKIAESKS